MRSCREGWSEPGSVRPPLRFRSRSSHETNVFEHLGSDLSRNFVDDVFCKISRQWIMHAADICFQKEQMGFAFSNHAKLGFLVLDINPVPAELFADALKENGNRKEIWKNGNQTEYKEMKSQILGRDEHFCTQRSRSCALSVHISLF